jgi:hypothetical protein
MQFKDPFLTLKRRIEDATGEEAWLAKTRQGVGAFAEGQNEGTAAQLSKR